jgi:hypothetical protein
MFISLRSYKKALRIKYLYAKHNVVVTLSFKVDNTIKPSMAQFMALGVNTYLCSSSHNAMELLTHAVRQFAFLLL